jgi:hypothetical protein
VYVLTAFIDVAGGRLSSLRAAAAEKEGWAENAPATRING